MTPAGNLRQKMLSSIGKRDYQAVEQHAEQLVQMMGDEDAMFEGYGGPDEGVYIYKGNVIEDLCSVYLQTGNYTKLLQCLDRLDKLIDKQGDSGRFGRFVCPKNSRIRAHLIRAETLLNLGDYSKALENAKRAYELSTKLPLDVLEDLRIQSLSALSVAYALTGDKDNAFKHINLLKELDTGFKLMGDRIQPLKYKELAKDYLSLGDYKQALEMIEQEKSTTLKIRGFLVGTSLGILLGSSGVLLTSVELALYDPDKLSREFVKSKCRFENGQIEDAKKGYDELLQEISITNNGKVVKTPLISQMGSIHYEVLSDRGKIAEKEKKLEEAVEFYKRSIDVIEAQRSTINTEASRIGFVGDKQKVYHRMISTLFLDGQYTKAFEYDALREAQLAVKKQYEHPYFWAAFQLTGR